MAPFIDQLQAVPPEMRTQARWVVWRAEERNGKKTKIPYQPARPNKGADSTDPSTWSDLDTAIATAERGKFSGVGFMFGGSGLVGVDLDHCFLNGELRPWARDIWDQLAPVSYCEFSPSGDGLHFITRGKMPKDSWNKRARVHGLSNCGLEMYDSGRYFTVTGNTNGQPQTIGDGQAAIEWLQAEHAMTKPKKTRQDAPRAATATQADQDIMERARRAANGAKFDALMRGDWSEYGSQSEADIALCNLLVFWTSRDAAQIDRIFRTSGLMRDKWDKKHGRDTYGNITIEKALDTVTEQAQGPERSGTSDWNPDDGQRATMGQVVWPDIIPFDELPPDLPAGLLPGILGEFSEGLSHATQTPRELAAVNVLGVVALAIQSKLVVRVKPDYFEGLNIFAIVASESGERKSSVVSACKTPVVEWEIIQERNAQSAVNEAVSKRKTMERAIDKARTKAAGARTAEDRKQAADDIYQMECELPEVPNIPRLLVDDVTPEALASVMAASGESIGMLEAEGGALDTFSGRYSNSVPNIDLLLKSFGAESVIVDRKGKDPIRLRNPRLTMVLTPQPSVLRTAGSNDVFMSRGLIPRCLLVVPQSRVGFRDNAQTIPDALTRKWAAYVNDLLNIPKEACMTELVLSPDAFSLWLDFSSDVEAAQRPGGEFEFMRSWASKLTGLVVRLAGLLHMAQGRRAVHMEVGKDTMQNAVLLATWAAEHAKHAHSCFGMDEGQEAGKRILEWLRKNQRDSVMSSVIYRGVRGSLSTMEKVQPGLNVLVDRGVLAPKDQTSGKSGRPAKIYAVNPALYERE